MSTPEYLDWVNNPTPENMANVIKALEPTINAEVQRFQGPKPLLRGKAKLLAAKAVKTYDPTKGTKLRSWVVTQLQPLSRYGQQLRPIHASEMAIRQAAEVNRITDEKTEQLGREPTFEELADETGLSVNRIRKIQQQVKPTIVQSTLETDTGEETPTLPGTSMPDVLSIAEEMVYESLTPRDKLIFDLKTGRHGKPVMSNQEIAKRLGVTPALISQRSSNIAQQISAVAQREMRM